MEDANAVPSQAEFSGASNFVASFANSEAHNHGAQVGHNYGTINIKSANVADDLLKKLRQNLYLTDPDHDLQAFHRNKGSVVPGTCRWILDHHEYREWLEGEPPQLLRIVGGPGVGKTMLSTYMVKDIASKLEGVSDSILAYYFCDNKEENKRTTTAVLRSLALQILNQNHELESYLRDPFEMMGQNLRDSVDALWTFVKQAIAKPDMKPTFLLIDALDELTASCRGEICVLLRQLFTNSHNYGPHVNVKILVTHRQDVELGPYLEHFSTQIELNVATTEDDVGRFIETRVKELTKMKRYPAKLSKDIRDELGKNANGTFLWASLILDDLEHLQANDKVRTRLSKVPQTLNETYDRILHGVPEELADRAACLLRFMVVAKRPFMRSEVAILCFVAENLLNQHGTESSELSAIDTDDLDELLDCYTCCGALVYLDSASHTINFVHQSAKDYLVSTYLKQHVSLSGYYSDNNQSNAAFFEILVFYMDLMQSVHGYKSIQHHSENDISFHDSIYVDPDLQASDSVNNVEESDSNGSLGLGHTDSFFWKFSFCQLIEYAMFNNCDHAAAAGSKIEIQLQAIIKRGTSQCLSILGLVLVEAARKGRADTIKWLLCSNTIPAIRTNKDVSAIHAAVRNGHGEIVRLLLNDGRWDGLKDVEGQTALHFAVNFDQEQLVLPIGSHRNGVFLEEKDLHGRSPLHVAVIRCAWQEKSEAIVRTLVQLGCDPNSTSLDDQSPLGFASRYGLGDVLQLLGTNTTLTDQNETYNLAIEARSIRGPLLKAGSAEESNTSDTRAAEMRFMSVWQTFQPFLLMSLFTGGGDRRCFNFEGMFRVIYKMALDRNPTVRNLFRDAWQIELRYHCERVVSRLAHQSGGFSPLLLICERVRFTNAVEICIDLLFVLNTVKRPSMPLDSEHGDDYREMANKIWKRMVAIPFRDRIAQISEQERSSWVDRKICSYEAARL